MNIPRREGATLQAFRYSKLFFFHICSIYLRQHLGHPVANYSSFIFALYICGNFWVTQQQTILLSFPCAHRLNMVPSPAREYGIRGLIFRPFKKTVRKSLIDVSIFEYHFLPIRLFKLYICHVQYVFKKIYLKRYTVI